MFVSRHEIRPSACRAICPGAAGRTLTLTIKACGHSRSIGLDTTFRICLRCALRVSFIVYNSYGHEWGHSVETFAERTTSHDKKSRRGAELSEAKTTPTSNKTTQTPSTNPDLRTVKSSMSSIQIRHSEQTVHSPHIHTTQPLPTVVESLTNPTTTLNVPHSHPPPVLQPYNAGRNGIGWVPERAGVECISTKTSAMGGGSCVVRRLVHTR